MNELSLNLCSPCALRICIDIALREGWPVLPSLCPECESKIAQAVRLIVARQVVMQFVATSDTEDKPPPAPPRPARHRARRWPRRP